MRIAYHYLSILGVAGACATALAACTDEDPWTERQHDPGVADDSDPTMADSDTGGLPERLVVSCDQVVSNGQIVITDDTNYTFHSTVTIDHTVVKDETDIKFDWSGVTKDFFGAPLDPLTDIDMVYIVLWNLTAEELAASIANDTLPVNQNRGVIMTYPNDLFTSQYLTSFQIQNAPLPPEELWPIFTTTAPNYAYPQDSHVFMVAAATGTVLQKGTRMLKLFNIDPDATKTEVIIDDDSTTMTCNVDLTSIPPIAVPAGMANLNIEWGYMSVNALGNLFAAPQITEVVVARYDMSPAELEEHFLFLEEMAVGWWSGGDDLAASNIDLNTLRDANGNSFGGIDHTGTWLIALFCGKCANPAPWSITLLQAC